MPVTQKLTLRILQIRKFLTVAASYMTADHRVHEPEAYLGMVVVAVEVLFL
jgi:hypothetical protein